MIAISVGYGSYSCGRYRKRASGRNDAEMDCRTERKNLSAVGKPAGEVFFFEIYSMLSYIADCMHRPATGIGTLQSLLHVADVCFLQLGALCRIDIVRELGVDGGHLRSVV